MTGKEIKLRLAIENVEKMLKELEKNRIENYTKEYNKYICLQELYWKLLAEYKLIKGE